MPFKGQQTRPWRSAGWRGAVSLKVPATGHGSATEGVFPASSLRWRTRAESSAEGEEPEDAKRAKEVITEGLGHRTCPFPGALAFGCSCAR